MTRAVGRMTRTWESLLIALYALLFEAVALAIALPLFVGLNGVPRHLGFAALLVVLGTLSVFVVARLALRHGPIRTWQRGCRIGLWAAAGFYLSVVALFGLLPAIAALSAGHFRNSAGYLAEFVGIVARGSYGLPVIVGALGGALYGWLRGRRAVGSGGRDA
jgi:hypothetical protein